MIDLQGLNEPQREAALHGEGPLLILAGAGSGKTRALTHRIARLIDEGVPPRQILAITFTNKAAREMRERASALAGARAEDAWIMTFHACCGRILRRDIDKLGYPRAFTIYDDDDQIALLKEILKEARLGDKDYPPRMVKTHISDAKNRLMSPDEWLSEAGDHERNRKIHKAFLRYEERLFKSGALDFDDMIVKAIQLLADHPPVLEHYRDRFRHIMVDEYQDTNAAQYEFIRLLAGERRNLCVVGDDDQSIYGWRGADIRNILEFERDFKGCKVIRLEQNYRSTGNILNASNQVIRRNAGRKEKTLWTESGLGEKLRLYEAADERDEAAWLCASIKGSGGGADAAVLYRMNAQSRVIEEALVRAGIRYCVYGGVRFYDRKEVRDLIAYLRLIANGADDVAFARVVNEPRRGIGDATVDAIRRQAAQKGIPMLRAISEPAKLGLSARAQASVGAFHETLSRLIALRNELEPAALLRRLIEETGFEAAYRRLSGEEGADRLRNIAELETAIAEYADREPEGGLEGFLENVALVTDLDAMEEGARGLALMTLHSAKGLEFDDVYLVGLEEGVFPSHRSTIEEDRIEEERRLCYVGMTRAKRRLALSCARSRTLYNQRQENMRSRFIDEIHPDLIAGDIADRGPVRLPPASREAHRRTAPPSREAAIPRRIAHPLEIPGVKRGAGAFVPSEARRYEAASIFKAGDRVRHGKFGVGAVVEVSGAGREAKLEIEFEGGERKRFLADLAPVIKIDG